MTSKAHKLGTEQLRAVVLSATEAQRPPLVPEIMLRVAPQLIPVWEAAESAIAGESAPPFWAFPWVGGQALARYVLDHPELVRGRRVLDFAAGCGLVGIAAQLAGAAHTLTTELDPMAIEAQRINAELNGVTLEPLELDLVAMDESRQPEHVGLETHSIDVVLAGDIFYERSLAPRLEQWLRRLSAQGKLVLVGDGRRLFLPKARLTQLGAWQVPTTEEIESASVREGTVWRVEP